jgi:hypothetical protein
MKADPNQANGGIGVSYSNVVIGGGNFNGGQAPVS